MTQKLFPVGLGLVAGLFLMLLMPGAIVHGQQAPPPGQILSPGQLDDMVAPIALYPDPLISQILVAATYPLEIVEASQWQLRNPNLSGLSLTQAAEQQNWDPSIQALVAFPDVLKYLTEDIAWTTSLGNAFLAQESDVMDAVQRMRARAAASGKLTSTSQQQVTRTYESGRPVYVIVPANPDIIYVPYYDPYSIWGDPFYYPYPRWYYPRYSGLYFGSGISFNFYFGSRWQTGWQGWNSWGWRPAWTSHNVIVNNTFVYRQASNSTYLVNRGTTSWSHDGSHRQGVPYPSTALAERFRTSSRDYARPRDLSAGDHRAPAPVSSPRVGTITPLSSPRTGSTGPVPQNRDVSRSNDASRSNNDRRYSNGYVSPAPRTNSNPSAVVSPRSAASTWPSARGGVQQQQQPVRQEPARQFAQRSTPQAPSVVRQSEPVHAAPQAHSAPSSSARAQSGHESSRASSSSRSSGSGEKSRNRR